MVTVEPRAANPSQATLTQNGTARLPLLLPDTLYAASRRYYGKRIRLTGTALQRGPDTPPGIDQSQYRDRSLSLHNCGESALTLYVDKMVVAAR